MIGRGSNWGYEDPFQNNLSYWSNRLKSAKDSVEEKYALSWYQYYDRVSLEAFVIWADRDDLLMGDHEGAVKKNKKKF